MIYPTIPCPDNLKPIFAKVLSTFKIKFDSMRYCHNCIYVCHLISEDESLTKVNKHDAHKFISSCIGPGSFGGWLIDNDTEYADLPISTNEERNAETHYENKARLAWLEFLVNS